MPQNTIKIVTLNQYFFSNQMYFWVNSSSYINKSTNFLYISLPSNICAYIDLYTIGEDIWSTSAGAHKPVLIYPKLS